MAEVPSSSEALAAALRDPKVSRVVFEGPGGSGRSEAVRAAVLACIGGGSAAWGDWVTAVAPDGTAALKSMSTSSISTFTRAGSFRVVLVDDVEQVLENRTRWKNLAAFLEGIRGSGVLKCVCVAQALEAGKRASAARKKLTSPEACDVLIVHGVDRVEHGVRGIAAQAAQILDSPAVLRGADLSYLVGHRCVTADLLAERMSRRSRATRVTRADVAHAEAALTALSIDNAAGFDELAADMAAGIKILGARLVLHAQGEPAKGQGRELAKRVGGGLTGPRAPPRTGAAQRSSGT